MWTIRARYVAVAAVAVLALSACGDDDDSDESSSGGGGGGDPIKVMTWSPTDNPSQPTPQVGTGVEARVNAINAAGGINGQQVEFEFCDTEFDPNIEASCARKAVENKVDAVIGSTSLFPNTLPILERAGIAHIGGLGLTPAELSNPISFPLAGGVPGMYYGAVAAAVERDAQRVAVLSSNIGPAEYANGLITNALEAAGRAPLRTVTAPIGQPDQAAAAAEVSDGSDAIILAGTPDVVSKVMQSVHQGNYPGLITGVSITFSELLKSLGPDVTNGLVLVSQTTPVSQTDDAAVAQFISEMDAVDPSAKKDERSMTSWAAMNLFAQLVERIDGDITSATVLDAMNNLEDPIDTGVTGPYRVVGQDSPIAELPQLHNPTVMITEVRDGQIVPAGDAGFINPFQEPTS